VADWRAVWQNTWRDKKIARLSLEARLLFVAWITLADDEGCLEADPETLKIAVFPADNAVSLEDIQLWSDEIIAVATRRPLAERWICGSQIIVRLPNFKTNQPSGALRKDRKKRSNLLPLLEKGEKCQPAVVVCPARLDKTRLDKLDIKTSGSPSALPPSATEKPQKKERSAKQKANDEVLDGVLKRWNDRTGSDLGISTGQAIATYCKRLDRDPEAVVDVILKLAKTNPPVFALRFARKLDLPLELETGPKFTNWQRRQANQKKDARGFSSMAEICAASNRGSNEQT